MRVIAGQPLFQWRAKQSRFMVTNQQTGAVLIPSFKLCHNYQIRAVAAGFSLRADNKQR